MLRLRSEYVLLIMLGGSLALAQQTATPAKAAPGASSSSMQRPATATPAQSTAKPKAAKTTTRAAEIPQPPPPPPTPEQMPAQPPRVRLANGMLTVEARNSTLSDVLTAIRRQTGAALELPPGAGGERVMAQLGPGQPKDIVASLLAGSNFDYIILGSAQRPGGLERIILTNRQANPAGGGAPAPQQGFNAPQTEEEMEAAESGDDAPPDREIDTAGEEPPLPEEPPESQPGAPGQAGAPAQPGATQTQTPTDQQPQVKTPEQLLRELQQMRQQQQQQQNPQNQQPQSEQPAPQDTPNQPPQ